MKKQITIIFVFINLISFAQKPSLYSMLDWNGYTQLRASSDFSNNNEFSLRRLKFWLKSTPEFSEDWSYKIQSTISSSQQEKFFLQDVKLAYKTGLFSFDIGQFVPAYSLQWSQPDYKNPAIERANVINILYPNGTFGVRDLGTQVNFQTKNKFLKTSFGIFNGYGIKKYNPNNHGFMTTHKTSFNFCFQNSNLQFGYSLQYRQADNLKIPKVLPDTISFSGIDFRYNFFLSYSSKFLQFQSEFLNANIGGQKAFGYYFLSTINIKEQQIVLSYEDYCDLISETSDKPYCRIGYNYLINKYKLKLSFDNYFQINNKIENYIASIQIQIFFK